MLKKSFTIILVFAMLLTLIAGCANTSSQTGDDKTTPAPTQTASASTDSETEEKENFNPTGYPIVDEPITVTGMFATNDPMNDDPNETMYWKKLSELTNVHVEWEIIENDETAVNLYYASGDFPDFFIGSLTNDRVNTYGVQGGQFLDISEMIYEYMPHMVSRFQEWPQMEKIIRELNGAVYTLPQVRLGTTAAYGQMFYRTDYVEEAGRDIPKTVDEFYETLVAISDAGLTKGFAPLLPYNAHHLATQLEGFLFPAFGDAVEPGFADDGSGKVVFNFISDQYKRYLEFMNKLYTEGLLEEEIFSMDPATTMARVKSGEAAFMTYAPNLMPEDFADGEIHLDVLAPLVSEYTDTQKVASYNYLSNRAGGINVNTEYPREILRFLDCAYAKDEIAPGTGLDSIAANSGIKGIAYEVNEENNTYEFIIPDDWTDNPWNYIRINHGWNIQYGVYDMKYYNSAPNAFAREKGLMTNNIPYAVDRFPDTIMKVTAEESAQMANKLTDINSYIEQKRAEFITGVEPLSNWDKYVETITQMGIEDVLKIKQTAYDRWNQ